MNTRLSLKAAAAYRLEQMLMHHIFTRLPVKTLLRFKSVSKAWNRIICDPHFIRLHFIHQQNYSQKLLFSRTHGNNYFSVDFAQSDAVEVVKFDIKNSNFLYPEFVGSYNGLVCISLMKHKNPLFFQLYLWNPLTTDTKLIPDPNPLIHYSHLLGFTYDSTLNDYKVVRIFLTSETCVLDIYSLKSNSWEIVKEAHRNVVTLKPSIRRQPRGFELNGFMYWHVYSYDIDSYTICKALIFGLCLGDKSFNEITLSQDMLRPEPNTSRIWDFRTLGRCLAAYNMVYHEEFVMWTMKDPEMKERKWEKFMTLSLCFREFPVINTAIKPICFTKDGKILLFIGEDTQQKFGLYEPQTGSMEFNQIYGVREFERSCDVSEIAYIETLVSPNMFKSKICKVTTRKKRKSCGQNGH